MQPSLIVHVGAKIIAESVPRRVRFKGRSKNFCRIVSKNFEEILEKDWGNCNEILQTANILKCCGKTVLNVLYNWWIETILRYFRHNSRTLHINFWRALNQVSKKFDYIGKFWKILGNYKNNFKKILRSWGNWRSCMRTLKWNDPVPRMRRPPPKLQHGTRLLKHQQIAGPKKLLLILLCVCDWNFLHELLN